MIQFFNGFEGLEVLLQEARVAAQEGVEDVLGAISQLHRLVDHTVDIEPFMLVDEDTESQKVA